MATPFDFMTKEAGGNKYANGAQSASNPYALPQNAGSNQQGMIRQPTQAQQTTNPQTGSSQNQTFSLYGGSNAQQGGNIGGTNEQSTRPTATTRPGIPGTSYTRDAQGNPVYANGQQGDWNTWNAVRPYGQQYGTAGTPGAYAVPQQQAQPNGGNIGGTYMTGGALYSPQQQQGNQPVRTGGIRGPAQQSNPYGVDTSMGGGAQPTTRTGGVRGPAQVYQPGSGAPSRSLQTQQYAGTQGQSAQPTNRPNTEWQPSPGATMPTIAQTQTQPGQNGWQAGPGATMPQMQQGGNGQTSPNPDPYGSPWIDYINADGTPHINYQYGQSGGGGGQGPTGPNPGSDTYWQNPNAILNNNRDPRLPQNDRGPMQYPQQQQGAPGGQSGLPFTWEQYSQARNDNPRIAQEWAQLNLPYAQLQQNTRQYDQDFIEAQRRYDQQFLQSQGQQAYDQMMQTRQQHMAEQQYQSGLDQWNQQFGWTQQNDRFNQDLALQGFTREGLQWNQQFNQANSQFDRNFALQQMGQNQQYGLDQDRLTLAQQQAQWGQQNAQQGLYYQGQAQSLSELANQQQYGLSQNQQAMQAQQMNQQYGLDIRGMNLQELQNTQQYGLSQNSQAMQQQQMLHSMGIDTRGMSLQEQAQAAQQAYQQQQLSQQATLTREQMASQERMATMAATGRQQAPSTRWVRSW